MSKSFNIRVYGLLINERKEVLISDEHRFERAFTKFPGGGLEWGEGTAETLVREFKEELNLDITVLDLFYVNDFFQASLFSSTHQLLSFYYKVSCENMDLIPVSNCSDALTEDGERFRWVSLQDLHEDMFTFPIDKIAAKKLSLNC